VVQKPKETLAQDLNWRTPENNSLLRQKDAKEKIINHKERRMVKDGEN